MSVMIKMILQLSFVFAQALTCLAETPEGRKALLDHVEKASKISGYVTYGSLVYFIVHDR